MRTGVFGMLVLPLLLLLVIAMALVQGASPYLEEPAIVWQQLLGGGGGEYANSMAPTADGGSILLGSSNSSASWDVSGTNHGPYDIWVVKLDGGGAIQWEKLLGGNRSEYGASLQQTADGGYIVLGHSYSSKNGDVTDENHGGSDLWVVKLSSTGSIQWQRLIGGSGSEEGASIQQTGDHGYILLGHTSSSASGDIDDTNHGTGLTDLWVVKLLENGVIEWERLLGGFAAEYGDSIRQTADGGYILLGQTGSFGGSGDVVGTYHGEFDLWVVNLDQAGAIQWQTLLGGTKTEHGIFLQQATDGGYILAGDTTSSANGDVVETSHGGSDLWVLKLDHLGRIAWQQLLGGLGNEQSSSLRPTADGGFVLLGSTTSSLSGDVADRSQGYSDLWTLKLDGSGAVRWQALYGGSGYEYGRAVHQAADGGYILVSDSTSSASGDVTRTNHAISSGQDIWIVKLTATPVRVVPGGVGAPTNTHADGPYDDVNGNGRADFADVVLYFNQMGWIAANEPLSAFDYNGNGRIDFADVVWLFNAL